MIKYYGILFFILSSSFLYTVNQPSIVNESKPLTKLQARIQSKTLGMELIGVIGDQKKDHLYKLNKVKELIEKGADINILTGGGFSALKRSVLCEYDDIVEYLLMAGVNISSVEPINAHFHLDTTFGELCEKKKYIYKLLFKVKEIEEKTEQSSVTKNIDIDNTKEGLVIIKRLINQDCPFFINANIAEINDLFDNNLENEYKSILYILSELKYSNLDLITVRSILLNKEEANSIDKTLKPSVLNGYKAIKDKNLKKLCSLIRKHATLIHLVQLISIPSAEYGRLYLSQNLASLILLCLDTQLINKPTMLFIKRCV